MFGRGLLVLCMSIVAWGQYGAMTDDPGDAPAAHAPAPAVDRTILDAYALLDRQEFKKAATEFAALAQSAPTSIEAQLGLVRALFQTGEFGAAALAGENAARLNPKSVAIHAMLADVYFRRGWFAAAEQQYKAALALDGNSGRAWIGLGKIYSIRSMTNDARTAFENARQSAPQLFSGWLAALTTPEQRATFLRYAVPDQAPRVDACEISFADIEEPASQRAQTHEIPLEPIRDIKGNVRGMGMKARISGQTRALMMLDTGASGITIGSRLAKKAGLLNASDRQLAGMGGSGTASGYSADVARLQIGNVELRNCTVQVAPDKLMLSQDAIIGTDVFQKYLITLDFPVRKLRISERSSQPAFEERVKAAQLTQIQAYRFAHMLLVPSTIGQGASGLFVLDSGANINTVSERLMPKVGGMTAMPRFVEGTAGTVNSALGANSVAVKLGAIELLQQNVASVDLSSVSKRLGTEVAGQIGLSSLENFRIDIDYKTGTLVFERAATAVGVAASVGQ